MAPLRPLTCRRVEEMEEQSVNITEAILLPAKENSCLLVVAPNLFRALEVFFFCCCCKSDYFNIYK